MPPPIISVENLGKRYVLNHQAAQGAGGYRKFSDTLIHAAKAPLRALQKLKSRKADPSDFQSSSLSAFQQSSSLSAFSKEDFWALKDVSFEVNEGEVLGIIGRNGAGKSTLLKILSRITEPTTGRITLRGRVASLLEVGTGFHPELTGRENIYLNGAILGMTKAEVRSRFDEIVAFAEVERFLDTPVKRYSSGMYVRLAFAVAAHLEPEILIVDEVLAVGDAGFQKKCLGKMGEVAKGGRTVLFVSHNMGMISTLCTRAIELQAGTAIRDGIPSEVLASSLQMRTSNTMVKLEPNPSKPCVTSVCIDKDKLLNGDLEIEIEFESPFALAPPYPGIVISTTSGQPLFGSNLHSHPSDQRFNPQKGGKLRFCAGKVPLRSGEYQLSVWLGDTGQIYSELRDILVFNFHPKALEKYLSPTSVTGHLLWDAEWTQL